MIRLRAAVLPAILALGLLGATPALAGGKQGDGGGGGHSKNGGGGPPDHGGGGGGGTIIKRIVVCVINNRVFHVARVEDCGVHRYVRIEKRRSRTIRYTASRRHYCGCGQSSVVKNGGDYVIGGGGFVGSAAAVGQARRRASLGYEFSGGYVGEPVYGGDAYVGEPVFGGVGYVGEGYVGGGVYYNESRVRIGRRHGQWLHHYHSRHKMHR
jgi:hypothetical protein